MRLTLALLTTLLLAASAISATHVSVKLQVFEIRPGIAKFTQATGEVTQTSIPCPPDPVNTDLPISDVAPAGSHVSRCPVASAAINASFNFTWVRAYVTPANGPTYEVLMYCHRTYSYCPVPQIGVGDAAELKSAASALELLSAYPNPALSPIKIKVRADAKYTAIWTIYYGQKVDPPQK